MNQLSYIFSHACDKLPDDTCVASSFLPLNPSLERFACNVHKEAESH